MITNLTHSSPRSSRGFTLIELVIVIAIIALIVTMSLSSYSRYRKSIALSLAADSLQSAVKKIQQQARSGKISSDGSSVCYGVALKGGSSARYVTAQFQKGTTSLASSTPCHQPKDGELLDLNSGVVVSDETNAVVYATPPRGELILDGDIGGQQSSVHFVLQFSGDTAVTTPLKMSLPFGILEKDL